MPEQEPYDSRADTTAHIELVQTLMLMVADSLKSRAERHDQSKLEDPEKAVFDKYTPMLKGTTYGSGEYKQFLKEMQVGLDHHYAANRHHPEHHPNGINDMNLVDIVEMFCDWLAATKRHADGDIHRSIEHNEERFSYSSQLGRIFHNTVRVPMMWVGTDLPGPVEPVAQKFTAEVFVDGMRLMPDTMTLEELQGCSTAIKELVATLTAQAVRLAPDDE